MEGQTKHKFWLNTIKTDYVVAATSTSFAAMDVVNAMVSCINMSLAITVIVLFPLKFRKNVCHLNGTASPGGGDNCSSSGEPTTTPPCGWQQQLGLLTTTEYIANYLSLKRV